jgi:hypothetical protein
MYLSDLQAEAQEIRVVATRLIIAYFIMLSVGGGVVAVLLEWRRTVLADVDVLVTAALFSLHR